MESYHITIRYHKLYRHTNLKSHIKFCINNLFPSILKLQNLIPREERLRVHKIVLEHDTDEEGLKGEKEQIICWVILFTEYCAGDQMKETDMDVTCSTHMRYKKNTHNFSRNAWREETTWILGVDWRIILKWILKKWIYDVVDWIHLV